MRRFLLGLSLLLSLAGPVACQDQLIGLTPRSIGTIDTGAPGAEISTLVVDPVLTSSILCYATFTRGPITGFTSGDVTLTNCTLTNFTQVYNNVWSFNLNPTIDGTFTAKINASVCVYTTITGVSVDNTASATFTRTYDSGASYDLENLDNPMTVATIPRGATYIHTETSDLGWSYGGELLTCKYNIATTLIYSADNASVRDMTTYGRVDFGDYILMDGATGNYSTIDPLITAAMNGRAPTVMGYKNGVTSGYANMTSLLLSGRTNLHRESASPVYATDMAYTGLTDLDMILRPISIRWDGYVKQTTTDYGYGSFATLVTYLNAMIPYARSNQGWITGFMHWPYYQANYPDMYYEQIQTLNTGYHVYYATYNEAAEYYYARESVTSITGTGNTITVNHTKDWPSSPYSRIQTPIWVYLNTAGTVFEGEDIACDNGRRVHQVSANVFYIPIMLDFSGSSTAVHIGITTSPNYVVLTPPVSTRTGTSVTVDQETMMSVYRVQKPTTLTTSVSSVSIPTADNTTVNLTVGTGLTIPVNTEVKALNDATHYFYGVVLSYTSGTGALSLSSSTNVGTGTFSSWTIQTYYHMRTADLVSRDFTYSTSHTISAVLDETNYTYWTTTRNRDGITAATTN